MEALLWNMLKAFIYRSKQTHASIHTVFGKKWVFKKRIMKWKEIWERIRSFGCLKVLKKKILNNFLQQEKTWMHQLPIHVFFDLLSTDRNAFVYSLMSNPSLFPLTQFHSFAISCHACSYRLNRSFSSSFSFLRCSIIPCCSLYFGSCSL